MVGMATTTPASTTTLDRTPYVTAWLIHRLVIGILGVAMPILLILGEHVLFSRDVIDFPRVSLSAYYYSGLAVIFIGTLIATGIFLITFKITRPTVENVASAAAGVGAIGVALFPTGPERGEVAAPIARLIGVHTCQVIHSVSAVIFIGGLAVVSRQFARNAGRWAPVHTIAAFLMVASAVAALIAGARGVQHVGPLSGLLLVELICTYSFGVSWLVRGIELRRELIGQWA
jgi:hypothetical protein